MVAERSEYLAVVGMGNLLLSDDGVGVHVLHKLQEQPDERVELIDAGTAVIHAADCLRGFSRVVVIDAFKGGQKPGTVYLVPGGDVMENDYSLSVHSLGLKTALKFLASGEEAIEWTLVGVEPERLDYGMQLSHAVDRAVPDVVRTVEKLIKEWRA